MELKQVFIASFHEGLLLHCFRMRPCSAVIPAPLNDLSTLARVHRPRLHSVKVVVERRAHMYRRGLLAKLSAALRRLELAGHDAGGRGGYVHAASAVESMFYYVRVGWWSEPRTRA